MKLSKTVKNFLSILVTKRRIFFLENIFKNFLILASKKRGELKISLISSKSLTDDELKNLNLEISKVLGTVINFNYKVDENLIGGLKMQIGSLMVDTSIKNKLKKYEQIMLES
jgi:F-type H+-transporting ATPase subunit delta